LATCIKRTRRDNVGPSSRQQLSSAPLPRRAIPPASLFSAAFLCIQRGKGLRAVALYRGTSPPGVGRVAPSTASMSSNQRPSSAAGAAREKTYFEQQREALIGEIAVVRLPFAPSRARRRIVGCWTRLTRVCASTELRTRPRQRQQAEPLPRGRHSSKQTPHSPCLDGSAEGAVLPRSAADRGFRKVGNEFSSVEALWSQFENVMAKDPDDGKAETEGTEGRSEGDADEGADETRTEAE